ncbi:MAG: chemotaxis protein CheD [Actinobacteria bacterium]|nr:chemotaxis protein CheD [Actinomycetota bacterium]
MRYIIRAGEMRISDDPEDEIITYSLGSCIAISIHDPAAVVGGLLHFQLPVPNSREDRREDNPYAYATTGIPMFFKEAYRNGAEKRRLVVKVAGGCQMFMGDDHFQVGRRNYVMMRRMFWKNGILIDAEDVGETVSRTMSLEVGTGRVLIKKDGEWFEL